MDGCVDHPSKIPAKDIVCEIEAAIVRLPEDTKDTIRTSTASILHRASLPSHNNITKDEKKALKHLEEEPSRVIMKADKGNCFVVLDKRDYDDKMESLPSDRSTNQLVQKSPFSKVERELNNRLLASRSKTRSMIQPTANCDAAPLAIRGSIKHDKTGYPLRSIVSCIGSALYNTSEFLTDILSPIQNSNGHSVLNSSNFANELK